MDNRNDNRLPPRFLRSIFELVKQVVSEWIAQDVPRMGAALAFYTFFAISPLFVIVLAIAGFWFGEQAARRELFSQFSGLVGSEGAEAIRALVSAAQKPILFLGAKFTQIYSNRYGSRFKPKLG